MANNDRTWVLEDLDEGSDVPYHQLPDEAACRSLCEQLKKKFTINAADGDRTTPAQLFDWACKSLDLDPRLYNHDQAIAAVKREHFRITRLNIAVEAQVIVDEDLRGGLQDALRVVTGAERFLLQAGRLYVYASASRDNEALSVLPKEMRVESEYMKGAETILQYDATKLDAFQQLFLELREQLESEHYRRADQKFFRRVKTVNGETTLAFEEATTIEAWVGDRCNYNYNFTAWMRSTRPSCNFYNIVKYLSDRPLPEAPDLKEHPFLRSFAGDQVGRGSGVYDCESDMFFPYSSQNRWKEMAAEVEEARRRYHPGYKCKAPGMHDTALLHLHCSFPYDIHREVMDVAERDEVYEIWREAYEFEVRKRPELKAPRLARTLAAELPPLTLASEGVVIYDAWLCIERDEPPPSSYARLDADDVGGLPEGIASEARHGDDVPLLAPESHLVYISLPRVDDDSPAHRFLVPTMGTNPLPRLRLDAAAVRSMVEGGALGPHAWVRDETTNRYFCVCLGAHWGDCESNEMDQIYITQAFTDYDRFQCYAAKGRQFFPVGYLDKHQFAFVLEGIGGAHRAARTASAPHPRAHPHRAPIAGCGKSTDLMSQVRFYPAHRQGMFPGNLEPLFGLSAACKEGEASALFCSEMSANMACKQEEFNQIISGDVVSAARKNKTPWVGVVRGQLFLVGNRKPGATHGKPPSPKRRDFPPPPFFRELLRFGGAVYAQASWNLSPEPSEAAGRTCRGQDRNEDGRALQAQRAGLRAFPCALGLDRSDVVRRFAASGLSRLLRALAARDEPNEGLSRRRELPVCSRRWRRRSRADAQRGVPQISHGGGPREGRCLGRNALRDSFSSL